MIGPDARSGLVRWPPGHSAKPVSPRGVVIQNIATLHEELSEMLSNELPIMIDTIIASRGATPSSNEHDG